MLVFFWPNGCAQYPEPHGPPPCSAQRPLCRPVVVVVVVLHPTTEHASCPPLCLWQYVDLEVALVVHPSSPHVPCAPCLEQRPRATESVVQPSTEHTFLLPPPCLQHRPLAETAVVQLLIEQIFLMSCFPQSPDSPRFLYFAMLLQPSTEHDVVLLSCVLHFPLLPMALEMHASVVQPPKAPCLKQRDFPRIRGVSQSGLEQASFGLCLVHTPFFVAAGVVQPSRRHSPRAPCFPHNPRAITLVVQPSTEHGLPPCFTQSCPL